MLISENPAGRTTGSRRGWRISALDDDHRSAVDHAVNSNGCGLHRDNTGRRNRCDGTGIEIRVGPAIGPADQLVRHDDGARRKVGAQASDRARPQNPFAHQERSATCFAR